MNVLSTILGVWLEKGILNIVCDAWNGIDGVCLLGNEESN